MGDFQNRVSLQERLMQLRLENRSARAFRSISVYPSTSELVSPNHEKVPQNIIKGPYENTRDYRSISVYPSTSELVSPNHKKMPQNIIKGPYENSNEYLKTHFLLLREDFIRPIRENVISYLKGTDQKLLSIKIHEVEVIRKGVKNGDTCFCFQIIKGITYATWNLKANSKRFMMGSLLIFSEDNFKTTFCGRVTDNRNIFYKRVLVSFEKPAKLKYGQKYQMIECYTFFEPYFYVMKVLQTIPRSTLSMKKYLIEAQTSVSMPKYLNGIKVAVSDSELNTSQQAAIKAALSQELVIIQGPPGTGKTFLGLKIAKKLLHTSRQWYDESPMLIISVTNHALDQFLEGLTEDTDKILRYGGQSKNPKMDSFSLRECRDRYYKSNLAGQISKRKINYLFREYCEIEQEIMSVGKKLDYISENSVIINFNDLKKGVPEVRDFFSSDEKPENIIGWLLEEDESIVVEKNAPGVPKVFAKQNRHSGDSTTMTEAYIHFVKHFKKTSSFVLISVSIIEKTAQKFQDMNVKITQGMERKKLKYESVVDKASFLKCYFTEKQKEIEYLNELYVYLVRKANYLKVCLATDFGKVDRNKVNMSDPFKMPVCVRWQLYKQWLSSYKTYLNKEIDLLIDECKPVYERFNEETEENNLEVMRCQKIIGMTTTSAARLHSTIKALKCPIVIVEEAAEALEAHIIAVLTEHCQHLILIGDHKQLKPSTADHLIETRYKLGVSLFERMVINDIECHTLNVQHRMRPEISSLVTPSIYPVLHNHESVTKFPQITGVDKCLYFITHSKPEQGCGDSSKKNVHEAKFLIKLAEYLLKNGYEPEEITILSPYLGQVRTLVYHQNESSHDQIKQVKITSVDNFQGEENKIILLSLVRNNSERKIGFLSIENRVCVALSRAREGMYVMGNMRQLSSSTKLWQEITVSLTNQDALGSSLPLKCQKHGKMTQVKNAEDFDNMAPDGGCSQACNTMLKCGHRCQRRCHNDDLLHKKYKCQEQCLRSVCKNASHKCQKQCYQDCGFCMHPLKQQLSCGHPVKCFMKLTEDYRCLEIIYIRLPCGHKKPVSCNDVDTDDSDEEDVECSACVTERKEKDAVKKYEKDLEEIVENTRNINLLSEESEGHASSEELEESLNSSQSEDEE